MKNATLVAAMLAVTLTATASPALAKKRPIVAATVKTIQKVDTDNSRTISASEFSAAGGADTTFAKIDANANGQIGFFELLMAYVYKALAARAGN
ncbi:EF-hand domain-containing protein [Polymorphobacter arshaanensis]|uniref:EF-hand domain-containing protein n=1 Tax=Glacieibacterium arshaanense TaxID=2511025 RepID=A0A4Y9ESA8_9SPHN|nr:EF-hand domain-containing protein [Polymorphobacter arshaanensis]TFU05768.1 EF-hand domain-containing protein [Polymorphobacter arshaanensis]